MSDLDLSLNSLVRFGLSIKPFLLRALSNHSVLATEQESLAYVPLCPILHLDSSFQVMILLLTLSHIAIIFRISGWHEQFSHQEEVLASIIQESDNRSKYRRYGTQKTSDVR